MEMLKHKFVDAIPDQIEEGIIYVSGARRTAIHLCICGCGNEVVTPISPTDWQLEFDGETISLSPSIGLWEFKCRSHYWIVKNQVRHSGSWNERQVKEGRDREKKRRENFYAKEAIVETEREVKSQQVKQAKSRFGWLKSFFSFLGIK